MKNKKYISISIKISILVMIISFIGIIFLSIFFFYRTHDIFVSYTEQLLSQNIDKYISFMNSKIKKLKTDITMLSYNPSIKGMIRALHNRFQYDEINNKTFAQYKEEIKQILTIMMRQNPSYFQIKIIDYDTGKEILKIIRDNEGNIYFIKEDMLQNKSNMSYFKEIKNIPAVNTYFSNINLNREFNSIEFPIKPTIRVGKVVKTEKNQRGIIIINANIAKLFKFNQLRSMKKEKYIKVYIANKHGDYIFNYDNPEKEFGFEFGRDYKITYDYPNLKKIFNKNIESLSMKTTNNLFEVRKIYIPKDNFIVVCQKQSTKVFSKNILKFIKEFILVVLIIVFIIALITTFLVNIITNPIKKLTSIAKQITKTKGENIIAIDVKTNDEIGYLARSFKEMLDALIESRKEIETFASKLEVEVEKKTKELRELNKNLQEIVEEKIKEIRKKDQALIQQSKMVAMGEMIGAIAHQWRQPLNSLALNIQSLIDMAETGECTEDAIYEFVENNMKTIQFMSKTIDDFRNFFKTDKKVSAFDLKEALETTIGLQMAQLEDKDIELITNIESYKVLGYKNEFMQVILNLISNARDAILEKRKKQLGFNGKIEISTGIEGDFAIVHVKDNGIAISPNVIDKIFDPYFTTKEEGVGIGLYMSLQIMKNMKGNIELIITSNKEKIFKVRIPLWKE